MRHDRMLFVLSILAIVLMTLHITDDIVRGISPPGSQNGWGVLIFVVWGFGALVIHLRLRFRQALAQIKIDFMMLLTPQAIVFQQNTHFGSASGFLGRPTQVTHYASVDGDVWLYRYKEQDVWNSMMSVEFNRQGVVQAMVNGPDEEREVRRR